MGYNLDALGWLQFQRLCDHALELVCGVDPGLWSGAADEARVAAVDGGLRLPLGIGRVPGPVTLVTCWMRPPLEVGRLAWVVGVASAGAPSKVVLTNLDPPDSELPPSVVATLGAPQLGALLDAEPELRLRVPSVLGVRPVAGIAPDGAAERSTFDVRAAHALARVFVPTRAYDLALAVLARHRFVVLTGPPEAGKTATATTVALARLSAGWEAHDCTAPEQVLSRYAADREQVFIADDAFGSTEYRPDAAERWARELPRILGLLDERHWLLWTSRPAPLRAGLHRVHGERGGEHFPSPAQVQVDASELDVDEKASILLRHAKAAGVDGSARSLIRMEGAHIVGHRHFTPERIRRFVRGRLDELAHAAIPEIHGAIEAELATPTKAMAASLAALDPEHRAVLIALLDTPPGPASERELAHSVRRHHPRGLSRTPAELIDRLTDHFVHVSDLRVTWVHPSWRDLVIEELAADPGRRVAFLRACELPGVQLALSTGGGARGERERPLLVCDDDFDALSDTVHRLCLELAQPDVERLLSSLETALGRRPEGRVGTEIAAVARLALDTIRRRLDREHAVVEPSLLEGWLRVAELLGGDAPKRPDLAHTWAALEVCGVDLDDPISMRRLDAFLAFAQLLGERAPEELGRMDFAERDGPLLSELVDRASEQRVLSDELIAMLDRAVALDPSLFRRVNRLVRRTPRMGSPIDDLMLPPALATSEHGRVRRILNDL